MKTKTATTAESSEALLHDLRALVSDAEHMLNDPEGLDRSEAVATLREQLTALRERSAEFYAEVRARLAIGAQCADQAIHARPYRAMAIALGAGLQIGVLVGRRNR
jgi:ElaB/YqjD/DUF883 family membrane-anchored ribosome-binding protein